jgi:hypothetical protein
MTSQPFQTCGSRIRVSGAGLILTQNISHSPLFELKYRQVEGRRCFMSKKMLFPVNKESMVIIGGKKPPCCPACVLLGNNCIYFVKMGFGHCFHFACKSNYDSELRKARMEAELQGNEDLGAEKVGYVPLHKARNEVINFFYKYLLDNAA